MNGAFKLRRVLLVPVYHLWEFVWKDFSELLCAFYATLALSGGGYAWCRCEEGYAH